MRLAVLGDPVAHSRSPAMHQAGLEACGIPGTYEAIRVSHAEMELQAQRVRTGDLHGANITMPHKREAARLADRLSPRAHRAGAVNTWSTEDGDLLGDNTDVPGVVTAMARRGVPADRVLVLGNGGAAAGALVALDGAELFVSGRRPDRAASLIGSVGAAAEVVPWGTAVPGATVVNSTPLGMSGESLPRGILAEAIGLLDMVYGDRPTPSTVLASVELDIPVADGIDLLVAQAEASFEIWTGRPPPPGVFDRVARNISSE